MKKVLYFITALGSLFTIACSSGSDKEEREKIVADSISRVEFVNDSIKKAEAYFPEFLVIQGTRVNFRVAPKLDADRIRQLKTGDTCEILEKGKKLIVNDTADYWYKVKFKNKEGWVFGAFTSISLTPKKGAQK